jgi:predicted Holliday junction resolvase-like endonuclease
MKKTLKSKMDTKDLIIGIGIGIFFGILIMSILMERKKKYIQKDAVRGSKNSIMGELYEKILPALPNFPYAPKDMVFIGK